MNGKTVVAIPTLGKSPLLWPMLTSLLAEETVDQVWVYDNGMAAVDRVILAGVTCAAPGKMRPLFAEDLSFYAMWNDAIIAARELGADYLAILNDDLRLAPGTIGLLAAALDEHPEVGIISPDYRRPLSEGIDSPTVCMVHGTYRQGGVAGFAFMVRAQTCPLINEQFEVWFGDDDLVAKIEAQGQHAAVLEGLPIEHEESTTLNQCEWVPAAAARDRERWAAMGRT